MSTPKTSKRIIDLYNLYLKDVASRNTEVAAILTLAHVVQETACDMAEILAEKNSALKEIEDERQKILDEIIEKSNSQT